MSSTSTSAEMPAPAASGATPGTDGHTYYECMGGRKTFFALTLVILLPFFVSLPVMITQRVMKGVWLDTWGLIVIAVVFTAVMLLVFFELMFSLRAKVDIGTNAVAFTMPAGGGGMTPMFFYRSRTIPYEDIAAVETYREIYGGMLSPVMLTGVRIVTRQGERIPLGFSNERDEDPRFPFPTIAKQIAARAGIEVTEKGNVVHEFHKRMFGLKSANEVTKAEIDAHNSRHNVFLITVVIVMLALLALGIGGDYVTMTEDLGERAPIGVQPRP